MTTRDSKTAMKAFQEYVSELADTWYDGDVRKAFRHAAFQQITPEPSLSDNQVIELTAIDKTGDLEVDGWFVDDTSEVFLLFQAVGGDNRVNEASVAKFWESPQEILNPERLAKSNNQSVQELSQELSEKLKDEYNLAMVFAAKKGFVPAARDFAQSKQHIERPINLADGTRLVCKCSLELLDERAIAQRFDDYRAGFRGVSSDVDLNISKNLVYPIDQAGIRSIRMTIRASEIVRVFKNTGFRLFSLNPRGPIANAKVNKNIAKTLDSPEGRKMFHLLNNGLCATCDEFDLQGEKLSAKNFQIVNGCQTTVTLAERTNAELEETYVDLKLAIADETVAQRIATASNSQTALRAKDYAAFERQQRQLQYDFEKLQPPWYYEIKQGYWRYVLDDRAKAPFKTGRRKRHIEVQPLAQACLAFRGFPAEALDRVRFVFQGIRSPEDRQWYDRAFPSEAKAGQLLLPWSMLDFIAKQERSLRFSTFHLLWLSARCLKGYYQLDLPDYFSPETSSRLASSLENWLPGIFRIANRACSMAFRRANNIAREQLEVRDFFRASAELRPGVVPIELLSEAFDDELKIEVENQRDPRLIFPH